MSAEEYLNKIPMWTREKNSLEEIRQYLDDLGSPDQELPIIHVAGSNGKGSVCAYLTSALLQAGYHVGTFVSPHLVDIRERFLLDGQMISREDFQCSFEQVKEAADAWIRAGGKHPTFFEFLFYMACLSFARKKVDFFVMETGLGGRLDATNGIRRPLLTVITSISLEHTQYLGDTIEAIAGEKAGIIKEGIPVIFDCEERKAARVILDQAKRKNASPFPVSCEDYIIRKDGAGQAWVRIKEGGEAFLLPFPAFYQGKNGALAFKALEVLIKQGAIGGEKKSLFLEGLGKTRWPGRMEEALPGVFLDGAHNPGGMEAFGRAAGELIGQRWGAASDGEERSRGRVLLLLAAVREKDIQEMIHCLAHWIQPDLMAATGLHSERGLSPWKLAALLEQEFSGPVTPFETAEEGFHFLLSQKGEEDLLFCAGSLYLIGELKALTGITGETPERRSYD